MKRAQSSRAVFAAAMSSESTIGPVWVPTTSCGLVVT
jgi:hypothetical protein